MSNALPASHKRGSETSESPQRPNKVPKRKNYVSRACNPCRRRKARCDAVKPTCGKCALYNDECVYSTEQDGRKPVTKPYVEALEQRIKVLEGLLQERNGSGKTQLHVRRPSDPSASYLSHSQNEQILSEGSEEEEYEDDFVVSDLSINRLKIDDDTGELRQYGPTSVFMHLPEPSDTGMSPPHKGGHLGSPYSSASSPTNTSEVEWSRHLPSIEGFNRALHDELVSMFFSYFNPWCCWVEPSLFRQDMNLCLSVNPQTPPPLRTSQYSPLLHNAILSLAANYSDSAYLEVVDWGAPFAARAKQQIDSESERPMLSTVAGLALLGSYHSGSAKHGLGYMYAGMGFRMSYTLGLGIDCTKWMQQRLMSESFKNERDRIFFVCYIQDKLWGTYVGRSPSLRFVDFETSLPCTDEAKDAAYWMPHESSRDESDDQDGQPTSESNGAIIGSEVPLSKQRIPSCISTSFLWTCKLAYLTERVIDTVYSLRVNTFSAKTQNLVSELDIQLEKWHADLPGSLILAGRTSPPPPNVSMLHAMYHFVVILLHRPFYGSQTSEFAVSRCNRAATRIVQLLEIYRQCPGLRFAPITLTQVTFTAGTSHLLGAVNQGGKRNERQIAASLEGSKSCIRALEEMGQSWRCATQSGEILRRLMAEWCPDQAMTEKFISNPKMEHTPPPVALARIHLEDPSSDLSKELIRLGWKPPANQLSSSQLPALPALPSQPQEAYYDNMYQDMGSTTTSQDLNFEFHGRSNSYSTLSQAQAAQSIDIPAGHQEQFSNLGMWPYLGPGNPLNWNNEYPNQAFGNGHHQ